VFGFFGQINPYKGLVQLLAAFEALGRLPSSRTADLRLNVHGAYLEFNPPDLVATIRRQLTATERHTRFFGPYSRDELGASMGAVDWVVVPSIWWENAPLVIEEALAHRRPVLCSNIGGMAEKVRPGQDGFHFPVGDPQALADLILRVASNGSIWDGLQRTMRRPVTIDESVARHLALYRERQRRGGPARSAAPGSESSRARSDESARTAARIIALDRGVFVIDVAIWRGSSQNTADGASTLVHVCGIPGGGAVIMTSAHGKTEAADVWLGPEGGTFVARALDEIARIALTVHGGDADTLRISVRRLFDSSPSQTRNAPRTGAAAGPTQRNVKRSRVPARSGRRPR
jgi:hypothetical protein